MLRTRIYDKIWNLNQYCNIIQVIISDFTVNLYNVFNIKYTQRKLYITNDAEFKKLFK